jgi:cytochrome c oxidase subunit 2
MTKNIIRCLLVFLLCLAAYQRAPIHAAEEQPRVIQIHAKRFSFTPGEITITKGEKVTLALTSDDTTHGLSIPDLGVNATILKGKVTNVEVTPQQAGTFKGMCSHFCGVGHGTMVFSVLVKDS